MDLESRVQRLERVTLPWWAIMVIVMLAYTVHSFGPLHQSRDAVCRCSEEAK